MNGGTMIVVEIQLFKERNDIGYTALSTSLLFVLFGSTVLIPRCLQSLYGYKPRKLDWCSAPERFVIVVMRQ